ncbi:MAG: hypothetical protein MZW92_57480 [Comamonadaceae bacterium]|nr:hypothetical protein [Comamonadaceae bacterium]
MRSAGRRTAACRAAGLRAAPRPTRRRPPPRPRRSPALTDKLGYLSKADLEAASARPTSSPTRPTWASSAPAASPTSPTRSRWPGCAPTGSSTRRRSWPR